MDKRSNLMVIDFGISDYGDIIGLQSSIVELRKRDLISDVLLLGEHSHVISLGFRSERDGNGIRDYGLLNGMNIPIYSVIRGGLATYHGPGQIVGYPIFRLRENGMRVSQFVRMIGDILVDVLSGVGILWNYISWICLECQYGSTLFRFNSALRNGRYQDDLN